MKPLRSLSARYALLFALLLLGTAVFALGLSGVLALQRSNALQAELTASFASINASNDLEALRRSGTYLSNRLFNPLFNLDVGRLNEEIAQIRSWLEPRSILLLDTAGRVVTDGTVANPDYGREVALPPSLAPGLPLIERLDHGSVLYFLIGFGQERAGYARVELSDARSRALAADLGGRVEEAWHRFRDGFFSIVLVSIALTLLISGLVAWWLSVSLSRPLREMTRAAERFARGDLGFQLDGHARDELGGLATSLNKMAVDLQDAGRLLDRAQEMASFGSWEWRRGEDQLVLSHGVYKILGLEPGGLAPVVHDLLEFVVPEAQERVFAILQGRFREPVSAEFAIRRADGEMRTLFIQGQPDHDSSGAVVRFLGTIQDVTEQQRSKAELQRLANYDNLTGLPNRHLFYDRLEQAIRKARRRGSEVALLFLDLDRFKSINDALGHDVGDDLLRNVARRLKGMVRESDTLARMGGDEFTLIVDDLSEDFSPQKIAQNLIRGFAAPFVIDHRELFITTSIGIALYPKDAEGIDALIKNADTAMYLAKEQGKAVFRFFTPELDRQAHERLALEHELRQAVERGAFELHYQPLVRSSSGELVGLEALLRWRNNGEMQSAARFVPVLEETGLITRLTGPLLFEGCEALNRLRADGMEQVRLCINLSAAQFQQPDLLELIDTVLSRCGLRPELLEVEITESTLLDRDLSRRNAQQLAERGVRLAIDDFGTGYSSLTYLKAFDVDVLKIDRSFVRDMCSDPEDAQITAALVKLAHSLGLECVAEGVEHGEQLERLCAEGCDLVQGYLVCRPLPIDELLDWIGSRDQDVQPAAWHMRA